MLSVRAVSLFPSLMAACLLSAAAGDFALKSGPLAERLCKEIDASSKPKLEKALLLNAWIDASISFREAPREDLKKRLGDDREATLSLMDADCGSRVNLMRAVLGRLGVESREICFFDLPVQLGHNACEAFIDGKWIFLDPTYGLYFVNPRDAKPLSLEEARALWPKAVPMRPSLASRTGKWTDLAELRKLMEKGSLYKIMDGKTIMAPSDGSEIKADADIEVSYIASEFFVMGTPHQHVEEVIVDSSSQGVRIGKLDGSGADIVGDNGFLRFQDGVLSSHVFLRFIGTAEPGGVALESAHKWIFTAAKEPHEIALSYKFTHALDDDMKCALRRRLRHETQSGGLAPCVSKMDFPDAKSARFSFVAIPPGSSFEVFLAEPFSKKEALFVDSIEIEMKPSPANPR